MMEYEKKVIETTLTEYENEQLKLLKSVFDTGCAFKMLALQKEASDWELKYLNEKKDWEYAQGQIERILIAEDLLKKELVKKESDTAIEFAKTIKSVVWEEFENETIRIKDLHGVIDNILRSKYGVEVE